MSTWSARSLFAGTSGSTDGTGSAARFRFPPGVAVNGNRLLVADSEHGGIQAIQ